MVSVEKDWVVILAKGNTEALATLNAQMRRIDLCCKLLAPLFISLIDGISTEVAIIVNFAMNIASVVVEYYAIARIYDENPDLQERKSKLDAELSQLDPNPHGAPRCATSGRKGWRLFKKSTSDFGFYFSHRAFLPSFAGSLLYLTVLSFSGQMVTYLFASGYTTTYIGIARTISVMFEVLATWVAPWLIGKIGPEVEAENRGRFSTIEAAWQNAFELLSYVSTIIFFRPAKFNWPALISVMAVSSASLAYTTYVGRKRGHLIHFEKLGF
ncbi:iron-regulated transporter [Colletotrichum tofieldiae]|nr:iron-regulated transporter [Colletotrichum tofieldiae]GKT80433.1 iron-regulated transporter [Colletotrichum tofieldiae]GKT94791.1 iron-regulated transporter [Colletotrichum tofieldiae]